MIMSLVTPPAALALDWDAEVKGHIHVDFDTEKARVNETLIPAATDWAETVTGRQMITATWAVWWPSFSAACAAAQRQVGRYPTDAILLPRPPLQSVTHIKYYDSSNTLQTWAASNYSVTKPAGPKASRGWIMPAPAVSYPGTYVRPDAVEVQYVAGYGAAYTAVPGGLRSAMLLLVGELFARREVAVAGTIIQDVPVGALHLALGYLVGD